MIKELELINFKCYQKQQFEFTDLTIFCGNNSSGKSTVIQSILLLIQSKFANKIPFNGKFVSLGKYDDIRNNELSRNDDLVSICIKLMNESRLKWSTSLGLDESSFSFEPKCDKPKQLFNMLETFQYIGAERLGPRDFHQNSVDKLNVNWLGSRGEYTSEVLSEIRGFGKFSTVDKDSGKKMDSINDPRIHETLYKPQITSSIKAWMNEISPGFSIDYINEDKANVSFNSFSHSNLRNKVRPSNVGFGLSYALSVVTALLITPVGGVVIIENPEAHLHPRGQSYLGRLIALTAEAGVQVIIETHSDHVINGIRVISCIRSSFDNKALTLYYVSKESNENKTLVEKIKLDKNGKLSNWPIGFFDQQSIDMEILINGINK